MEKEDILEQLFNTGYVVKSVDLIPGKLSVDLRNVGTNAQLDLEKKLNSLQKESYRYALQMYSIYLLARTIENWDGETFDSWEQAEKYLTEECSSVVIDKLVQEQRTLENSIRDALGMESVQENFSQAAGQAQKSEPQ